LLRAEGCNLWGLGVACSKSYRGRFASSEVDLCRYLNYITGLFSVQKIMLDTNEYDRLLADPETYGRLLRSLSKGKIELVTAHVQRDEIIAVDDAGKKARLEALLAHARLIATRGFIWDKSRWDLARFGNDKDHNLIEHVRGTAWERKSEDALIAATAAKDADVFVTDDKRLARRLNTYPGMKCEVIDFEELKRRLTNLAP